MQNYDEQRLILISNDDSYTAGGINHLTNIAKQYGKVVMVAPETAQSGKSASITIETPLVARKVSSQPGLEIIAVNGTPVDCIKLACNQLLERKPDLVLVGINHGLNSSVSVTYSGTMGAAFEGLAQQVPSIAFSYGDYTPYADFTPCNDIIHKMIQMAIAGGVPDGVCLNVNIPKSDTMVTRLEVAHAMRGAWVNEYTRMTHPIPGVGDYYWLTGDLACYDPDPEHCDMHFLRQGIATVTPCHIDRTNWQAIELLHKQLD